MIYTLVTHLCEGFWHETLCAGSQKEQISDLSSQKFSDLSSQKFSDISSQNKIIGTF